MSRVARFTTIALVALFGLCCARQQPLPSAEEAYAKMDEALTDVEDAETNAVAFEDFVRKYPDSERTADVLNAAIYFRSRKLGDPARARALAEEVWAQATDPELRFKIGLMIHELATEVGEPFPIAPVAEELVQHRELGFVNHLDVVEAAVKTTEWQLVLEHAETMEKLANAATFRADYPDTEFTDEAVERKVSRRRSWCLAYRGGALLNLGRLDEARQVLEDASGLTTFDYLGVPETPIYRYWAETELRQGNAERAAELLAPEAVMGEDPDALASLRSAYTQLTGSADGFDDYLSATRRKLARQVDDVTLADYSGKLVSLSEMSGKVILLAFWNPG